MTAPAIRLPDAIVTLSDEHRYMRLLLETMQEQLQSAELSAPSDFFLLQDLVSYMNEYPDAEHHPTEDLMFDKLVKRNPSSAKDVARLRREHEMLHDNTAGIMELLDTATQRRSQQSLDALRAAADDYIDRLDRHMQFEESVLFPSAVRCLAHKDWREIDRRLESARDPLFGPTVEGDYRVLYEYFSGRAEQASRQMSRYGFVQLDNLILVVDVVETGIADLWQMLQMRADGLVQEFSVAADKTFDGRGLFSAIGVQAGFAGTVGMTACAAGIDATKIYLGTLRDAALSFLKGAP